MVKSLVISHMPIESNNFIDGLLTDVAVKEMITKLEVADDNSLSPTTAADGGGARIKEGLLPTPKVEKAAPQ